jgi:hypothetical protein
MIMIIMNDMKNESGKITAEKIKLRHQIEDQIEDIDEALAKINGEKHASIIREHLEELSSDEGELSTLKM